jgi:hypothetical protein
MSRIKAEQGKPSFSYFDMVLGRNRLKLCVQTRYTSVDTDLPVDHGSRGSADRRPRGSATLSATSSIIKRTDICPEL